MQSKRFASFLGPIFDSLIETATAPFDVMAGSLPAHGEQPILTGI